MQSLGLCSGYQQPFEYQKTFESIEVHRNPTYRIKAAEAVFQLKAAARASGPGPAARAHPARAGHRSHAPTTRTRTPNRSSFILRQERAMVWFARGGGGGGSRPLPEAANEGPKPLRRGARALRRGVRARMHAQYGYC